MIFCFFPNWQALESQRPGLEVFFVFLYLVNISAKAFCWKTVTQMIWMISSMWLYIVIYPSGASSLWGISMFSRDHARSLSLRLPDKKKRGMLQPHCYMGDCQGLSNNGVFTLQIASFIGTMMIDHQIWGQPTVRETQKFQLSRPASCVSSATIASMHMFPPNLGNIDHLVMTHIAMDNHHF